MNRLLGVDLGTRRIGLALAEPGSLRARPLATITRAPAMATDCETLVRIAASNGIGEVVVGLPLDMAGTEGEMATAVRAWATALAAGTGLPVFLRDERLSSHVAESRVGPARRGRSGGPPGPTRRAAHRARIDREAAAVILEDELAARALGVPGEIVGPLPADDGRAPGREPVGHGGTGSTALPDRPSPKSGTIARPVRNDTGGGPAQELEQG